MRLLFLIISYRGARSGKDALILLLWEEMQKLKQGQQKKPKKTSENSSIPPSQGFKPSKSTHKKGGKRLASLKRVGGGRPLHENPNEIIEAVLTKSCASWMRPDRTSNIVKLQSGEAVVDDSR